MIYIEGYALLNSSKPIDLFTGLKYYKLLNVKSSNYYDLIEKVIKDAILDAKILEEEVSKSALFIGTSSPKLPLNESYIRDNGDILKDVNIDEVTDIISQRVGIDGFKALISTACTSSSNALIQAKEMIESGLIDRAIVVGVELYNELSIKGFDSFMLLSRTKMRPFDKNRDGIILGEAVSAIILSKNRTDFKLIGGAIKIDTTSITAPTAENLSMVMGEAISNANISIEDIIAIKTHSTATVQNDAVEAKAIHNLFGEELPIIITLKPYIGHTLGASGTSELALLIKSLKGGYLPKSINFKEIDKECNITPTLEEIDIGKKGYLLLNYFGFGGNNSCLVLEYGV